VQHVEVLLRQPHAPEAVIRIRQVLAQHQVRRVGAVLRLHAVRARVALLRLQAVRAAVAQLALHAVVARVAGVARAAEHAVRAPRAPLAAVRPGVPRVRGEVLQQLPVLLLELPLPHREELLPLLRGGGDRLGGGRRRRARERRLGGHGADASTAVVGSAFFAMDLSRLNPPQRQAVTTTEGPVLVLAGAGSGKTRVITHRIAHLLNKKVPAKAILAVTFTNKAAAEMKERVVHLAGPRAEGVLICTFHAFGAEVLREEIRRLGFPKRFAIADMGDQLSIIKRAMKERRVDDRAFDARKVLTVISRAKNSGVEPQLKPEGMGDDYDLIAHEVFPLYQRSLRAQGAVDFDDLLVLPAQLLREHPEVKEKYTRRFRYLLVDEFQDTNRAQMELLELLAGERHNVCAVGDDDQCIYSWRGAEVRNVLDFEKAFPGGSEVRLEQNYRSTQVVLDAANAVIAQNPNRKPKRMWTDKLGGERIKVVAAPAEDDEARYVVREIGKHLALGIPPDEIAVLYRTNGQAHPVEEALREQRIAFEVVGGS